jgi:hypothetical protein
MFIMAAPNPSCAPVARPTGRRQLPRNHRPTLNRKRSEESIKPLQNICFHPWRPREFSDPMAKGGTNLTTDNTDDTDLHGSKKSNKTILSQ